MKRLLLAIAVIGSIVAPLHGAQVEQARAARRWCERHIIESMK